MIKQTISTFQQIGFKNGEGILRVKIVTLLNWTTFKKGSVLINK